MWCLSVNTFLCSWTNNPGLSLLDSTNTESYQNITQRKTENISPGYNLFMCLSTCLIVLFVVGVLSLSSLNGSRFTDSEPSVGRSRSSEIQCRVQTYSEHSMLLASFCQTFFSHSPPDRVQNNCR